MDIRVLNKIRHNGKIYAHGDIIKKIKKDEGERLIQLSVAEDAGKKDQNEDDKKKIDEETK